MTDWFGELSSAEFLELSTNTRIAGYPLQRLRSGLSLVKPNCVRDYHNLVIARNLIADNDGNELLLWNVRTEKIDDEYKLVGKHFTPLNASNKPFKYQGPHQLFEENFLIVMNSASIISKTLRNRTTTIPHQTKPERPT